ncbi:MAG: peptidase M48 [Thalassobius sp.]|nr:peptidase M48 [Thalassovita sp.]
MIKHIFSILLLIFSVFSCQTVPVTGRSQLALIPNSELLPMSFQNYDQVLQESKLSNNQAEVAMIKKVGQRIQLAVERYMAENNASSQLSGFNWEFNLIEDDNTVNAWCMPGGKVAFYTGILPICEGESGVAIVMGHEVAHAIANHGGERMSQSLLAQLGLSSLQVALGENPSLTNNLLLQSVGIGTQVGMLSFSRQHESEADRIGLIFSSMAGYDPREAPEFWERMKAASGGSAPPEFLSTHPSNDRRIRDLTAQMPEAIKIYEQYKNQ